MLTSYKMPFNLAYEGGPGEYKLGPSSPGGGEVRDKLLDVDKAIEGRLPEWETLIEQAVTNTKEQFCNSPRRAHLGRGDGRSIALHRDEPARTGAERIRAEIKSILRWAGRL